MGIRSRNPLLKKPKIDRSVLDKTENPSGVSRLTEFFLVLGNQILDLIYPCNSSCGMPIHIPMQNCVQACPMTINGLC